ncbi:MAG: DUF2723 domain-containing protein, partial [Chloroflexi bacterium]|nr:DUF2723 domain-containing protein [Chloroflexota bacterium]
ALAAILFAVSRVEWSQAVIPRVYTLHAFFVVAVTALLFLWRAGRVDLRVPIFVFGLSLTNHRTMIWFAPALAIFIWQHERAALLKPQRLAQLALAFLAPLLLYLYVLWRGESDVGVEFHWKDFNEMILGGNVSRFMRYGPLDWIIRRVTDLYLPLLIEQFTPLGFVAGIIGAGALALKRAPRGWRSDLPPRAVFGFFALANLGNSAFCFFFNTLDVEKFFIPSYLTFLFFVAVGIAKIGDWFLAKSARGLWLARVGVAGAFLAASAFLIAQNFARNDWSARTDIATAWQENLAQPLEQNALIVGAWESLTPLEYLQAVDGARRDVEHWKVLTQKQYLGLVPYGSRQDEIEREIKNGRAVYLTAPPSETETLTELADKFRVTRVAELWRVINLPPRADAPAQKINAQFTDRAGNALELIGYSRAPDAKLRAGDFVLVTLFWRAPHAPRARYTVSLRVVDAQNRVIAQRDAEPASGLRPTIGWSANEIIQDDAGIFLPRDLAPGAYQLVVIVYNSITLEDLETSTGTAAQFGEMRVEK